MKKRITLAVLLCMLLTLFVGCTKNDTTAAENEINENDGVLVLKVNPELEVSYNQQGLVTKVEGINDDGKNISAMYQDYIGKECTTVLSDLVTIIENEGFINNSNPDQLITIEISAGSYLPNDEFVANITDAVQNTVNGMQAKTSKLPIEVSNNGNRPGLKPTEMSKDIALEIALNHAKLTAADVKNIEVELEDGKRPHYDVEFETVQLEYSYEIDAEDGTILKVRTEKADFVPAITKDKALEIALADAGVALSSATNVDVDLDDSDKFYEVSFEVKDTEYIYTIDAESGAITSSKKNVDNEDDKLDDQDDADNQDDDQDDADNQDDDQDDADNQDDDQDDEDND